MIQRLGGIFPQFLRGLQLGLNKCRTNSYITFGKRIILTKAHGLFESGCRRLYEKKELSDLNNKLKGVRIKYKVEDTSALRSVEREKIDLDKIQGTINYGEEGFYIFSCICSVCNNKITKKFSKKAYNEGIVIIKCDKCENHHLVSDRLGWFGDNGEHLDAFKFLKDKEVSIG
ncbi:DNL zinc finger domain-containing protein [Cryptosporidium felis]|nr:DNL zinc finger domain-containing protein [Cryptosporidium felis]